MGSCRQILSLFLLLFFPLHFWLPTSPQPHTLPFPSCLHLLVCITLFALFLSFPLSRDARYPGAGGFRLDSRLPSDWANLCEASSNGHYDCQLSANGKLGCEALVVSFLLGRGVTSIEPFPSSCFAEPDCLLVHIGGCESPPPPVRQNSWRTALDCGSWEKTVSYVPLDQNSTKTLQR